MWNVEYLNTYVYRLITLYRVSLTYRVVKKHILGSTPVKNIASIKRSVLHYRMMFHLGMAR